MNFTYFKGPDSDMSDLLDASQLCSICNQHNTHCFDLEYAICAMFSDKAGKRGCYECLKKGEFEFWHDTEFGLLDEDGLTKVYNHNIENPPPLSADILTELRRTPQIITWQQELWLTHCDDFMIYKGTWQPTDFYRNSPTGNGRDLFIQMTDKDLAHLWEASSDQGQTLLESWYATYYVFECRHCGKWRGYWDCD